MDLMPPSFLHKGNLPEMLQEISTDGRWNVTTETKVDESSQYAQELPIRSFRC